MAKSRILHTDHYAAVMDALSNRGLLLGSYDAQGKPNLMTIGWCSIGSIWGQPICMVLVRPSRHTYHNIEHNGCFTVNVPTADMSNICMICGSKSGRDIDKFVECDLTHQKAQTVLAPAVAECPIVYECQVVHTNDILPEKLADEILSGTYMDGDYHRVYFGKIMSARAEGKLELLLK